MKLVFNASPVIILAKAGLLEAFLRLGEAALIPQVVVDEVCNVSDPMDAAKMWCKQGSPFMRIVPTPPLTTFLAGWNLGAGESAVIAVANEHLGAVAVLDDLAGRRCAQAHGISVTGTLGLVLLAKKRGLIAEIGTKLEAIVKAGLYVSEKTLADVLARAGE